MAHCDASLVTKQCVVCGAPYKVRPDRAEQSRYCSRACQHKALSRKVTLTCERCGKTFERRASHVRRRNNQHAYCSKRCADEAGRVRFVCAYCGAEASVPRNYLNRKQAPYRARYCSRRCFLLAARSDDPTKRPRYVNRRTGKPAGPMEQRTCPVCGSAFQVPPWSTKRFCSRKCVGKSNGVRYRQPDSAHAQTTLRKMMEFLAPERVVALYEQGYSIRRVAATLGVSIKAVNKRLRMAGVAPRPVAVNHGNRQLRADDGHWVQSLLELAACNWLHKVGIEHEVHVRLAPDRHWTCDLRIGDLYIELDGYGRSRPKRSARVLAMKRRYARCNKISYHAVRTISELKRCIAEHKVEAFQAHLLLDVA